MEEQPIGPQSTDFPPAQVGMTREWRPPVMEPVRSDYNYNIPRRLEWIAVVLFVVNFFMMIYTYSLYYRDEGWGLTMTAISTATAVILLLSIIFSIFGMTALSKITVGVGIMGLMITVVSLGAKLMQIIAEWNDRWYY